MAAKISLDVDLALDVRLDSGTCPGGSTAPGSGYTNKFPLAADLEISQQRAAVDPGPDPLPFPANLQGRFLYFKALAGGPFDVTVTHDAQGATVYPVAAANKNGMLVLVPADDEFITGVTVEGAGEFEWLCAGDEA